MLRRYAQNGKGVTMRFTDILKQQLNSEFRGDAHKCLAVCEKIKELNDGHLWKSKVRALICKNLTHYHLTKEGEIFYKGLKGE